MAKRGLLLLAAAALLAAGTLLPASSALASKQAVVKLSGFEGFFFTGYNFRTTTAYGTATIYTETTPTPRIVWPAKILSGMSTQVYSVTTTPNATDKATSILRILFAPFVIVQPVVSPSSESRTGRRHPIR